MGFHSIPAEAGATIATGSYTGNNTANRAIPHGLGATPKVVFIIGMPDTNNFYLFIQHNGEDFIRFLRTSATSIQASGKIAVTAMDGINFYVGNASQWDNSANYNTYVYQWVAIQ